MGGNNRVLGLTTPPKDRSWAGDPEEAPRKNKDSVKDALAAFEGPPAEVVLLGLPALPSGNKNYNLLEVRQQRLRAGNR